MKRAAIVVALAAAVSAAVVAVAVPSDSITGPISLVGTVKERHTVQPDGEFPGRQTWLLSLASVRRKGKPFGYAILTCAFVSTSTTLRQCSGTLSLPRGRIIVAGSFLYDSLYELAVTGGTGLYAGVGGNLSVRRFVDRTGVYWFTVILR